MTTCAARSDSTGAIRCALCRVTWDRDEVRVCAREVPTVPAATRAADEALRPKAVYGTPCGTLRITELERAPFASGLPFPSR